MGSVVTKDLDKFKKVYRKTNKIQPAMLAAGYSEAVASKGIRDLPAEAKRFVLRHNRRLEKIAALGRAVDAQMQEDIARGALIANISEGKDRAVQSIKLAGQDRRVGMWQSEAQTGVFIIEMPGHLAKHVQSQVIDSKDIAE